MAPVLSPVLGNRPWGSLVLWWTDPCGIGPVVAVRFGQRRLVALARGLLELARWAVPPGTSLVAKPSGPLIEDA